MPDISQIKVTSGNIYNIKDAQARSDIAALQSTVAGTIQLKGATTTALADEGTTNPITIDGASYTAVANDAVFYNHKEFVFDGTKWHEFGDMTGLGALATKDSASGTYTPEGTINAQTFTGKEAAVTITATDNASGNYQPKGTVSKPTFTGDATTSTGKFTPAGSVAVSIKSSTNKTATVSKAASGTATYTPEGTVAAPTVTLDTAGATATVNSITDVGTLPTFTTEVKDEVLEFTFGQGTLPTKGANTTVKTGDASYVASAPAFTGTGARLVTGDIAVPDAYEASFTGSEGTVSVEGTPTGSVSQPTFTGQKAQIEGKTTADGTIQQATFTGKEATITVS